MPAGAPATVGSNCFSEPTPLTRLSGIAAEETVVFPAGLQTIGKGAFEKCNFKYVEIPSLAAWTQIDFENYTANPSTAVK